MKNAIALILALSLASTANAQFRRSFSSCAPSYAPSYSYAPTYYPQVYEEVRYREVLIPLLQPYPVFVDPRISYHYLAGNALNFSFAQGQMPMMQQQIAANTNGNGSASSTSSQSKDTDIDSLIDRIERRVRERSNTQAYEPDGPPLVPGAEISSPLKTARNALHVLAGNCAGCHTGDKSKGNFVIFDSPGRISQTFDANAAWEAITDGRMPPKERPRVKAADLQILKRDFGL